MSRVVVVGDLLLDTDVVGRVERVCPDAPAPVLDEESVQSRAGGAGLAATLLARDGHDVVLVAALAADEGGQRLRSLLAERGVELVALPEAGRTREKRRLRAQGTSIARWDSGQPGAVQVDPAALRRALAGADAVLCSDYGAQVLRDPDVRAAVAGCAGRVPVVWDPHPRGGPPVPGSTAVTPNLAEARTAADVAGSDLAAAARAADTLVARWSAGAVVVTLGARGALSSVGAGAPLVVPPVRAEHGDPCGAGDRFASALAGALAGGAVLSEAVGTAVASAADFVAAGGAGGLDALQPAEHPTRRPPVEGDAAATVAAVRARGGTVVATGGCFDLLHAGHVACLQRAATLGDCLVVALNSDDSVRRLKGEGRPLQAAPDRARVLAALDCVDAVAVFEEDTPEAVLERLRPDVWVKGGDYGGYELPEAAVVQRWGGQVVVLPYLAGRSTTGLVAAARGATQQDPTVDETSRRSTP